MKKDMAAFLQEVQRKSLRQRRIAALFLALSLTVTSGVAWALHGVGITLANEAAADTEEHVHSDVCYAKTLICGMEEDENHTHSDECYADLLICTDGKEDNPEETEEETTETDEEPAAPNEVIIDTVIGDPAAEPEDDAEDPEAEDAAKAQAIADAEEKAIADFEIESDVELQKALKFTGAPMLRAAGDTADGDGEEEEEEEEPAEPALIDTVDNIAEGIKFTLFDYGDADVDSSSNEYNHPKYVGINSGRDIATDILFFAYGTPAEWNEDGTYTPNMNQLAGDYREQSDNHPYPQYSRNRPVQGIVESTLDPNNPYPKVAVSGNSLDYLFAPSTEVGGVDQSGYKKVYENVNHFLQRRGDSNTLFFDSNETYAYFDQDSYNFDVYKPTFLIENNDHTETKDPFGIGFFPFDEFNPEKKDPNWNGNGNNGSAYNHHFGMTMEADFLYPEGQEEPITFKYSGDDDMWVFVDGELMLDIGGIHEPTGGMIDFTNGLIWTQDNEEGMSLSDVKNDLRENWDQFKNLDEDVWEGIHTDETDKPGVWENLPKPLGVNTSADSISSDNKWIVKQIEWPENQTREGEHNIKMFYLERGGCYSNLAMEMNLPTLKPLVVRKSVNYKSHQETEYDNKEYQFQVWEKVNGQWVIPNDSQMNQPFYLKDGEYKKFDKLAANRIFQVVEVGVDPNIYESVKVNNDEALTLTPGTSAVDVISGGYKLSETNVYEFDNRIREEKKPLKVDKQWRMSNPNADPPSDYKVKFKIYRIDSKDPESKKAPVTLRLPDSSGTIRQKRTFILDSSNQWHFEAADFPTRYGDHIYTYEVEEQNVPDHFTASYGRDENGDLTITNIEKTSAEIHVRKDWVNYTGEPPEVNLVLERQVQGLLPSTPTNLRIDLRDTRGELIQSYTPTDTVYVDGDAEFSIENPNGFEVISATASPEGVTVSGSDGFFEVKDLKDGENVVTITVAEKISYDDLLLLHYDFTDRTYGCRGHGNATKVQLSGNNPYAINALRVYDRSGTWNGVEIPLSNALKVGSTYSFSVYVYSQDASDTLKLTFNDGVSMDEGHYDPITTVNVEANTWTRLAATYTIPEKINTSNVDTSKMYLLVESANHGDTVLRIDEFTAIDGNIPVYVDREGRVSFDPSMSEVRDTEVVFNYTTMQNYESDGWYRSGSPDLGTNTWNNNHAVSVYNRKNGYDGIDKNIPNPQPGETFHVHAQVDGRYGEANRVITLVTKYTTVGSSEVTIPLQTVTSGNGWKTFDLDFTLPDDLDTTERVTIGFQGSEPQNNEDTSFDVWNCRLDRVQVTQMNQYSIYLDPESITKPLKSEGSYHDDTDFKREITLTGALDDPEAWKASWKCSDLGELSNHRYLYRITEAYVNGVKVNTLPVDGKIYSEDGNYLITYSGNDIEANTADNPIVVTNKYIWYKLPATGGLGTGGICAAGVVLALTGFIGGIALKKREGRYG